MSTAQRFEDLGAPDLIIGNNYDKEGRYWNLTILGRTLFSGRSFDVHRWSAVTGEELGPFALDSPIGDHTGGTFVSEIGTTTTGDVLFAPNGQSTQQRNVARYGVDGRWLRDYTAPELMHVQGSPNGSADAVFVASRFNLGEGWREEVLMFAAGGTFVGLFAQGLGLLGDVEVMGDRLYVMNYDDGVFVYDLDGAELPTLSHVIPYPPGVEPDSFANDALKAHAGFLYVADTGDWSWYKLSLAGEVIGAYEVEIVGEFDSVGPLAVLPRACRADFDEDGFVSFDDLLILLTAWGNEGGTEDLDDSGFVEFRDLVILLASWGPCDG